MDDFDSAVARIHRRKMAEKAIETLAAAVAIGLLALLMWAAS